MSADNYYLIRKHPQGGYVALMGFESDDDQPTISSQRQYLVFSTVEQAVNDASQEYSEYGVRVHPECYSESENSPNVSVPRHLLLALMNSKQDSVGYVAAKSQLKKLLSN